MSTKRHWLKWLLAAVGTALAILFLVGGSFYWWWFKAPCEVISDVPYGRRGNAELLLDVFRPPRQNGAGIVVLVSGGWRSGTPIEPFLFAPLLRRGYTVFAVRHVSQPECPIGGIVEDMHRAVRFIRHGAAGYGIDPGRIGVTGGSSGGHLALMLATCGGPGPGDAADPVDRESSAVQCVACFYPPTDLLNLGASTENPGDGGPPKSFKRGFGPRGQTLSEWKLLGRELSPIYHVTSALPPILIVHGDADTLVPLDQSLRFAAEAEGVGRPVRLEVRPGKGHGWPTLVFDLPRFADWFDEHLARADSVR
jgi:acetyl esterase/lipase